ncbi:MAG: sugar phosphate nucleotidyltransferase [Patescibacteria group bacterium]|nr:sugar phosphate nucleotidyltransferase [Patescibacteria group bacterium]
MTLDGSIADEGVTVSGLKGFKYRPPADQAQEFFESGRHAWNLGYFVSTPRFILGEFKKHTPGIYEKVKKITRKWGQDEYRDTLEEIYPTMEKISFDNAVLENLDFGKTQALVADLGWSDIGTLYAYKEHYAGTEKNFLKGDVIDKGSKDILVCNATKDQFIATAGLEGVVVVATDDAIMVCGRDEVRRIKEIVNDLEEQGREKLI